MHQNRKNEQDKVKVSIIADRRIVTVWYQETMKTSSAKKNQQVKQWRDGRQTHQSTKKMDVTQ